MPVKIKDSYQIAKSGLKALEDMQDVALRIEANVAYLELFDNMPSQKAKGDSMAKKARAIVAELNGYVRTKCAEVEAALSAPISTVIDPVTGATDDE